MKSNSILTNSKKSKEENPSKSQSKSQKLKVDSEKKATRKKHIKIISTKRIKSKKGDNQDKSNATTVKRIVKRIPKKKNSENKTKSKEEKDNEIKKTPLLNKKSFETPSSRKGVVSPIGEQRTQSKGKFQTPINLTGGKASSKRGKNSAFRDENSTVKNHNRLSISSKGGSTTPRIHKVNHDKQFKDIVENIENINKKKSNTGTNAKQKKNFPPKKYIFNNDKLSESKDLFDSKYKKFINLKDVNEKRKITTLEILLAIIEVGTNGHHYDVGNSNRSVSFWEKVSKLKTCENIFNSYRAETIRKYWKVINQRNIDKVISIINRIKSYKVDFNVKLKSLIYFINDFLKGKFEKQSFESLLIDLYKTEKKSHFLLKQQKKKAQYKTKKFIGINNPNEIFYEGKLSAEFKEKKEFCILNDVIQDFKAAFPKDTYGDVQIFNALYLNSMNLQKAYEFLKNPVKSGKKNVFSTAEDFIIKNLSNSEKYNQLVKEKGLDAVLEREKFLLDD